MARTKKSKSAKQKSSKSTTSVGGKGKGTNLSLEKEHEDDVRETLLCVLRTKRIPKQTLLEIAACEGIENHVASTLDKVRGVDTMLDDDNTKKKKKKKKKENYYDPSILIDCDNDDANENDNELIFQEVIDLARGGIGGQYTNTLLSKNKNKRNKKKGKKKKRKLKREMQYSSSLNSLPSSPRTKKRKLSCKPYSSLTGMTVLKAKTKTRAKAKAKRQPSSLACL